MTDMPNIDALDGHLADAQVAIAAAQDDAAAIREVASGLEPPPVPDSKTWAIGMATEKDKWQQRLNEVGAANARRLFRSNWDTNGMLSDARACHDVGTVPYVSTKMSPKSWAQVANGDYDQAAENLGRDLAALGYYVRVNFHHEPRGGSVDTPAELKPWGEALTRLFKRMRTGAGDGAVRLILGPTDNGSPWTEGDWGRLTDDQLAVYYTDAFVSACDVMGADFYDGETDGKPNSGEAAWVKMRGFAEYFDRRGFVGVNDPGWRYDVGEWNFIDAEDCADTWAFFSSAEGSGFNHACLFNSANNNRDDLPERLGGSWVLKPGSDRMAAFQEMLASAGVPARTYADTEDDDAEPH